MRVVIPKAAPLAIALGFCFTLAGFSQTTVNFGIQSAGPNNLGGVFTDPYNGSVNGNPVLAFCDDFTDDVNPPQYWTALVTDLSQLPDTPTTVFYTGGDSYSYLSSTPDLGGSPLNAVTFSETEEYTAAAILAVESLENSSNAIVQEQISFALWAVFDPSVLAADCNAYGCLDPSGQPTTNLAAAQGYLSSALQEAYGYSGNGQAYETANNVDVVIYTPYQAGPPSGPSTSGNRPQEFITVTMPEPSELAALLFDFIGLGIVAFVFRRRQSRVQ